MAALFKREAFSVGECERIIVAITAAPSKGAMLVGQTKVQSVSSAKLVWTFDADRLGWVMDRLLEIVRKSNVEQFDFDLYEFAESPQVASYKPLIVAI